MTDKSRAKLRPRSNRNIDSMMEKRAANITAQDIAAPATPPAEAPPVTPPTEAPPAEAPPAEAPPTEAPPAEAPPAPASEVSDDDWVNGLTPVSADIPLGDTPPPAANTPPPAANTPSESPTNKLSPPTATTPGVAPEPEPESDAELDRAADERRLERMRSMTTVDEDVAQEIYNTVIKPEIDDIRREYNQQVSAISGTLTEQQKRQEEADKAKRAAAMAKTNEKILAKYPQAGKILQSAEFMEALNAKQDPYAQQSNYDILNRAYSAGDAEYVLRELDAFAETRRKPKPQSSVDVNSGGTPNTSIAGEKKPMTQQQYLSERKAIMSRRHKPSDLTELHKRYVSSQQ